MDYSSNYYMSNERNPVRVMNEMVTDHLMLSVNNGYMLNGPIPFIYKNLITIGESGTHKSALLSRASNTQDIFKIGDSIYPETRTTYSKTIEISKDIYVNFNDTPYLQITHLKGKDFRSPDTSGQQDIGIIVKRMHKILQIDLIWLCVNASSPQYKPIKNIMAFFEGLYPGFLNHVELVFTNWVQPNPTRKITIEREFKNAILRDFNHESIKCHFID